MRIDQFISGAAVDSLTGVLLLVGVDGSILDANPAALDCYGYSHAELLALSIRDIRAPAIPAAIHGELQGAAERRSPCEVEHRRADGTRFPVEVRSTRVGADGETAILYSVRDITEQERLAAVQENMMTALIDVVGGLAESRDPYTAGHQRRVSQLATAVAREMGMSDVDIDDIRVAGLLHDIGKVSVPAEILSVAGQLSSIEFEIIKDHAEAGYRILSSANMEGPVTELVYQHHERCDGSGYPRGLSADELLPGSKILMVADVVEAMSSHRPHRPAHGVERALDEIAGGAGQQYDSQVAESCLRVFRERGFVFLEPGEAT